jgi:methylenetetrahydrofolate reductase (NADPH)
MSDPAAGLPSLAPLLQNYSVEVSPTNEKIIASCAERLDPGTEVYLTWIPGEDPFHMVAPAGTLRRAGLFPAPHIVARHLESAAQLDDLLRRFAGEAGVDRGLLVGGERAKPLGPYDATLQVMQSGLLQKHKILRVGISGFPEGHPAISEQVLGESIVAKMNYARQIGLQVQIVTQFCFEGQPIVDWLKRMRAMGVDLPVRIGLAGPASIATLMKYALHCGVGNSIRALTKSSSFGRLLSERDPEPVMRELLTAAPNGDTSAPPFGIAALHFYTFGGLKKTVEWINAARA